MQGTPEAETMPGDIEIDNLDEIEDSEPEVSPSPPRRTHPVPPDQLDLIPSQLSKSKSKTGSKCKIIQGMDADRLGLDFDTQSVALFKQITATVKAAPRSMDLKTPSWWEKMLMYDPVVLEDFTAWLNGQGLRWKTLQRVNGVKAKRKGKSKAKKGGETGTKPSDADAQMADLEPSSQFGRSLSNSIEH